MAGFNFNIPDDVHAQFKSNCALDEIEMTSKLVQLIRLYNQDREENRGKR